MLKTFASVLLISSSVFSRPLPVGSQYPTVISSSANEPVCYMQTADGKTLDLTRSCGKGSENSTLQQLNPAFFENNVLQQTNSAFQACRTKAECLTIFGSDNPPPPLPVPLNSPPPG